jgi:Immunity protein 50
MSDWADLLDDPRTIRAIFGDAPSLDQVELNSVVLDGPAVKLHIELAESEFPVEPPEKWREAGFNRAYIFLLCLAVRSLEIRGLETDPTFDLSIEREDGLLRVSGGTDQMSVDIRSEFLRVTSDSVKAYQRRDDPVL